MRWSRVSPFGDRRCCTANCGGSARWHAEAGEREASIGSDYCSTCRDALDAAEIVTAARAVVAFDWSDNDADAVAAIERLRHAVSN